MATIFISASITQKHINLDTFHQSSIFQTSPPFTAKCRSNRVILIALTAFLLAFNTMCDSCDAQCFVLWTYYAMVVFLAKFNKILIENIIEKTCVTIALIIFAFVTFNYDISDAVNIVVINDTHFINVAFGGFGGFGGTISCDKSGAGKVVARAAFVIFTDFSKRDFIRWCVVAAEGLAEGEEDDKNKFH